ncbi:hypothetical protein [Roseomonas sp. KE2513]|uniref:hypothetical protein n=1 Tax=Roseomonas sp. KE2513 TaxID=2479202 RepID=UPI0018E01BCA|nr:hypothetical protein [Roseomonas sp. KE2513]
MPKENDVKPSWIEGEHGLEARSEALRLGKILGGEREGHDLRSLPHPDDLLVHGCGQSLSLVSQATQFRLSPFLGLSQKKAATQCESGDGQRYDQKHEVRAEAHGYPHSFKISGLRVDKHRGPNQPANPDRETNN